MATFLNYEGHRVDLDFHLSEVERLECEESLAAFLRYAWRFIDPAPYVHGWVVDALAEHLEAVCDGEINRLLINIPPRCLKSSLCSVAFPAWVWAQPHRGPTSGPGVPFLHASYAHALAMRDSVKRRRLMKSTWYRNKWAGRFSIIPDQDQKIRFANDQGGESLITSVEASVTGEGGNIIVVDDPNNAKEVLSEATIQSTNEDWWDGTMSTRLNDPKTGAVIVIQQRLGELDLTGHILEKEPERWTHLCLPMEFEKGRSFVTVLDWRDPRKKDGDLLWPERFGLKQVRDLEASLKKWRAAGQLQQRPEPAGGGIIKRDWWQVWPPGGEQLGPDGQPLYQLQYPPMEYIVASLDTAYTENTLNDPSALTVWGVFQGDVVAQHVQTAPGVFQRAYIETSNRVMLCHSWADHLEIHDLVNKVHKTCQQFKVDALLIEDKAAGLSVAQELRRLFATKANYAIRVMRPIAGGGYTKNSKVARLYSVQNIFEEKMVYAPERPFAEAVMAQCGTFPNAQHDDLVDTCLVGETMVRMANGSEMPIVHVAVGDLVATPEGPRRVLWSGQTGMKEIWRLTAGDHTLEGTAEHPIFANGAWIPLAKLHPGDMLETWCSNQSQMSDGRPSSSTATATTDIQTLRRRFTVGTSADQVSSFIKRCGKNIAAQSQRITKSITRTATRLTTASTIWSAFPFQIIGLNMLTNTWRADDHRSNGSISPRSSQRPPSGIAAKKGGLGTRNAPSEPCAALITLHPSARLSASRFLALGAGMFSSLGLSRLDSAPLGAKLPRANTVAVSDVSHTRTTRPVYNLTISGCEMFYANGLLVHNCSQALRYLRDSGILVRGEERMAEAEDQMQHRGKPPPPLYPA